VANPEALRAFGYRVRAAREAKGLSQEGLADLAGLHRTYVSGAERGTRNVSLTNILRLARALDVRPGELVDGLQS
jgi:transcriptional regulator with XRE-family HTH domain